MYYRIFLALYVDEIEHCMPYFFIGQMYSNLPMSEYPKIIMFGRNFRSSFISQIFHFAVKFETANLKPQKYL